MLKHPLLLTVDVIFGDAKYDNDFNELNEGGERQASFPDIQLTPETETEFPASKRCIIQAAADGANENGTLLVDGRTLP